MRKNQLTKITLVNGINIINCNFTYPLLFEDGTLIQPVTDKEWLSTISIDKSGYNIKKSICGRFYEATQQCVLSLNAKFAINSMQTQYTREGVDIILVTPSLLEIIKVQASPYKIYTPMEISDKGVIRSVKNRGEFDEYFDKPNNKVYSIDKFIR